MSQRLWVGFGTQEVGIDLDDAVEIIASPEAMTEPSRSTEEQVREDRATRPPSAADFEDASISARVANALLQPIGGLGIRDALMPGDRLAIAVEPDLPCAEQVLQGVLRVVEACEPGEIKVVTSAWIGDQQGERIRQALPSSVELIFHNISDRDQLSYLGADEEAEPIRLSNVLVDSDVVLPISVMRYQDPLAGGANADVLCPGLSDQGVWNRLIRRTSRAFENLPAGESTALGSAAWADRQIEQVRWALGAPVSVGVEVIAGGAIGRVLTGDPSSVRDSMRGLNPTPDQDSGQDAAEVTIVCVEGDESQQTLANLVRAAWVGRSHSQPTGSVVVVSDIRSLSPVAKASPPSDDSPRVDGVVDEDATDSADETIPQSAFARRLLTSLINGNDSERRYLLWSRCPAEMVESVGFGVIENEASLARLIQQHPRCRVVRVAQTATVPRASHTISVD